MPPGDLPLPGLIRCPVIRPFRRMILMFRPMKVFRRSGSTSRDIEGCVEELARRLEMKPGRINIKVLARMFRDTVVQYDILHQGRPAMFSDLLDVFGPDQSMWARFASKNSPVGYLIEEFMRKQAEYQDDDQDDQDDDQDDNRAEVEEAKARIMEVLPGMTSGGGPAFVKAFEISLSALAAPPRQ